MAFQHTHFLPNHYVRMQQLHPFTQFSNHTLQLKPWVTWFLRSQFLFLVWLCTELNVMFLLVLDFLLRSKLSFILLTNSRASSILFVLWSEKVSILHKKSIFPILLFHSDFPPLHSRQQNLITMNSYQTDYLFL